MNLKKVAFVILLGGSASTWAQAHAFLDHAQPRVGSTVTSSPPVIKIWFTEKLEGAFSRIRVYGPNKSEVDRKDVKIDPADGTLMSVSLPKLAPGIYQVEWSAVAVDTHHTTGTFTFRVTGS